jgi:trigger factor
LEGIPLKVDIQDVSSCKKTLKIEIPAEDVSAEFEVAYEEVRTTIPVPGFRKGRAPRSILRMRFGEYVKGEVIEKLIPSAFEGAIGDADLEILRPLDLTDMNPPIDEISVKDGEPLIFEITVDVKPEIPVPNLTLLEVEKGDVNVTKEDVDEYIQQLREERADFIPVEDRPVQEGDYVTLIISATSDGDALEQFDDEQVLKIGKDMEIPELAEYILGMKPDEEKEFSISFPPDYQ